MLVDVATVELMSLGELSVRVPHVVRVDRGGDWSLLEGVLGRSRDLVGMETDWRLVGGSRSSCLVLVLVGHQILQVVAIEIHLGHVVGELLVNEAFGKFCLFRVLWSEGLLDVVVRFLGEVIEPRRSVPAVLRLDVDSPEVRELRQTSPKLVGFLLVEDVFLLHSCGLRK